MHWATGSLTIVQSVVFVKALELRLDISQSDIL